MATRIGRAAATTVAGITFIFIAAGCRTPVEERRSDGSASAETSRPPPPPGATEPSQRAAPMGAGTAEQQSRTTQAGEPSGAAAGAGDRAADTAAIPPGGAAASSAYELTGRVEKIDPSSNTLQIAGKTVVIDSSTAVDRGGVGATLDDIEEGDEVRAHLSLAGDRPKAAHIEVISPAKSGTTR